MVQRSAWTGFGCALLLAGCGDATQPLPTVHTVHTQLAFTGQPISVIAGATLTPPIQVEVEDLSGIRVDAFAGNVTIAIGANPGGGTLSGTKTVAASNGVANFHDLSIDAPGNGYTLRASAAGPDAATSASFNAVFLPPCLTNDCWTVKAPMPTVRESFGVAAVNGMLYTVGGAPETGSPHEALATVEAYDPNTNRWITKAPMPTARPGVRIGVVNGVLYAVGGTNVAPADPLPTGTVEAYDPVSDTWTTRQPIPSPPFGAGVGVVNGVLYSVGGIALGGSGVVVTGTLRAYDPVSDTWTTKAPMPTPRLGCGVGVVNGILYDVGGDAAGTVEAYDPATDTWTTRQPMLTPRPQLDVGVVNGTLYAVGGTTGDNDGIPIVASTIEAYDPATNTWTSKAPMPTGRLGLGVAVLNGVLYAVGGRPAFPGFVTGANEAYHP